MVDLRELTQEQHEIAERFWQLFLHDLSEFRDSHPDEHGAFKRRHLEPYLVSDSDRVAYVVYGSTGPVGLAFVYGLTGEVRRFDQFFIVRSQRRAGVGRAAAEATVRRFPGRWEVGFQDENPGAAKFWRRLASEIGTDVHERLQPVPDKPHIRDDVISRSTPRKPPPPDRARYLRVISEHWPRRASSRSSGTSSRKGVGSRSRCDAQPADPEEGQCPPFSATTT